ncbi:MAG: peptidoglycan editing factor PgeF [Sulfurimonas sp.]|nr:peptidoglycan editing factor PgeF [Sulfurimonas sp.]
MQIFHSNLLDSFSDITHAFTTKDGGVSGLNYNSLNLAFHVQDDAKDVESNHTLLADTLGYQKASLVYMKQIHSNIVHIVEKNDNFKNPPTCDALITNKIDTPLMVMVADCSPILFYDKKQKVIAVAHAGRAGAFKNIVKNTLDTMSSKFNSVCENIYISIGANIKVCCYEVGIEIYKEVKKLDLDYGVDIKKEKYYLNINKILLKQLLACGIKKQNIDISQECTSCNTDKYYSYRDQKRTGRFCGVIMLK